MSGASPSRTGSTVAEQFALQSLQRTLEPALEFAGFWAAVVLPFVTLGLLATGLAGQPPLPPGGLLATNVAALVLGKDYKR